MQYRPDLKIHMNWNKWAGDILSTGYYVCEMGSIQSGDTVAVIGAGPVGMCSMLCAKLWGPSQVIAVDIKMRPKAE